MPEIKISKIVRIGKYDENKSRPLRLSFTTIDDKETFYRALNKLKDAPENLKCVSIRFDLSPEDYVQYKELVTEAGDKNNSEKPETFFYRVRGNPGAMKIVRIAKK